MPLSLDCNTEALYMRVIRFVSDKEFGQQLHISNSEWINFVDWF